MAEWKEYTVADVISTVIDYRGKTPKKLGGDWSDSGYRALSAKNIKTGKIVQPDSIRYVAEDMYRCWMKDEVQKEDILITSEAPFGQIYYWDSDEKIVLSQRLFAVRINQQFYPKYIYFYMTSSFFQAELDGRATGTTVVGLRQPELLKCKIFAPDYQEQKRMADTLWCLEQKINNNEAINNNLLEQIRTICTAWLSDYEPFDGVMPSDWVETPLSDIAEFISGYSYKGTELTDSTIAMATIKNFDRKGGFKLDGYKDIIPSSKLKESQHAELFDTLVAHTDLTQNAEVIGNAEPVMSKSGYDDIVFSMDLVKVLPKKDSVSKFLIAAILQDKKFKAHCLGYINGTTVLHLSKKALPEYKLFLPSDLSTLKPLDEVVTALYKQVSSNISENTYLEELRESLLPKLMSGELDVSTLEF